MLGRPIVRRLPPPNPSAFTGDGTNTYLVGDRDIIIVDPGPDVPDHIERIISETRGLNGAISALLVTHAHSDHLAASYELRERTGASIFAYESVPGVDCVVKSGYVLTFDSYQVEVYETPGHSDDHVCFLLKGGRVLFSGDLVSGKGSVLLSESPNALSDYLTSLKQMLALSPSVILPGHGATIWNPTRRISDLIEHREMRSRQIMDSIGVTPRTIDELVDLLYRNTAPELLSFARRNVKAHLELLSATGEVFAIEEKWAPGSFR